MCACQLSWCLVHLLVLDFLCALVSLVLELPLRMCPRLVHPPPRSLEQETPLEMLGHWCPNLVNAGSGAGSKKQIQFSLHTGPGVPAENRGHRRPYGL
jgi:hypothetical protein